MGRNQRPKRSLEKTDILMINSNLDMSEIIPNLWVGAMQTCIHARNQGINTLCVYDEPCPNRGVIRCVHRRILPDLTKAGFVGLEHEVEPDLLTAAVNELDSLYDRGPLLVHCGAGIERSPLVVAVWMTVKFNISLDHAYHWIKNHRPTVEYRGTWLKGNYKNW